MEFLQDGDVPGTKFTAFHALRNGWPTVADDYSHIMLLDDDIVFDWHDVDRLFALISDNDLTFAQAALSADSPCSWSVLKVKEGTVMRYMNAVEVMMPVMSRDLLRAAGHVFGESISGWGLDLAIGKIAEERFGRRTAVIDAVAAVHTKEIDEAEGALYRMLTAAGIYPVMEMRYLAAKYQAELDIREVSA